MKSFSKIASRAGCRRSLASLCALSALLLLSACDKPAEPPPPTPAPAAALATNASVAPAGQSSSASAAPAEFQKLVGRWLRPDGGYVLDCARLLWRFGGRW